MRVLFPAQEKPREPGLLDIGYVLVVARQEAVIADSTSQSWRSHILLPAGPRLFHAKEAAGLNQSRAFVLRLDVLARLPMTRSWFPAIEHPDQGVIAIAPPALQSELTRMAVNIARRRREVTVVRGP